MVPHLAQIHNVSNGALVLVYSAVMAPAAKAWYSFHLGRDIGYNIRTVIIIFCSYIIIIISSSLTIYNNIIDRNSLLVSTNFRMPMIFILEVS